MKRNVALPLDKTNKKNSSQFLLKGVKIKEVRRGFRYK